MLIYAAQRCDFSIHTCKKSFAGHYIFPDSLMLPCVPTGAKPNSFEEAIAANKPELCQSLTHIETETDAGHGRIGEFHQANP